MIKSPLAEKHDRKDNQVTNKIDKNPSDPKYLRKSTHAANLSGSSVAYPEFKYNS